MRWLAEEHDLSSRVSEVMLLHLEMVVGGWYWCSLDRPSRAGSGNAHCTIRMSTSSTGDLFDACKKGDIARVRQAVADGVNVRKVVNNNWDNSTLLHYTCRYMYVGLVKPTPSTL